MKLARYRVGNGARWGIVDLPARTVTPLHGTVAAWGPQFMLEGPSALPIAGDPEPLDLAALLAPHDPTSKVVGTGANYMAHLERLGVTERPATTVAYFKPTSALVPPEGQIAYPSTTNQLDYEVELVAVIGSPRIGDVRHGSRDVLGFTVGNDISARDATSPIGGPDLFSMKGLDDATPVGPWITTYDELGSADVVDLALTLRVNGQERQRDRTSNMLWTLNELIEYLVARTRLSAGDLVFTGTTAGVGAEDGRFLQPGDLVEAEIEGIGILRNTVGSRPTS
jgi:2-keto-4-pentenoate hydratase/2-oxohepta-3-ene-1,7-dioic acid hydratase in catechol pathway